MSVEKPGFAPGFFSPGGGHYAVDQAVTAALAVIPAKAGIQRLSPIANPTTLDSRLRGNDGVGRNATAAALFEPGNIGFPQVSLARRATHA